VEWKPIYENTELRFGKKNTHTDQSYGFVVAVPRRGIDSIKRSGFSLVYWTKHIEFPTVHEQATKTSEPILVDMDATLVGLNLAIPQNNAVEVKKMGTEKKKPAHATNVKWLNDLITSLELPTHGILNSKPKAIPISSTHFITFLDFTGKYLNINIPACYISNDQANNMILDVQKVCILKKAEDILEFQTKLNKNLQITEQIQLDVNENDSGAYKTYMGTQMVIGNYATAIQQEQQKLLKLLL